MGHDGLSWRVMVPVLVAIAAIGTALLIRLLMPTLARYALARPNARSSHKVPTPQGGGIAIITVVIAVTAVVVALHPSLIPLATIAWVLAATLALAIVGAFDDIVTLGALPRLVLQLGASIVVLAVLPASFRIVDALPLVVERGVLVIALVWFVNLVNFMDGLDWITIAEVIPLCAGIVVFAILGEVPALTGVLACAIGGAMLGFAPFNRPVARLFLGDVGSLPLGLLLGWLLVVVAGHGHLAAAVLLPLYYLADATITLVRRLARGERVWQAHRTHFYQRATDNGYTVTRVVSEVFVTNLVLVSLAIASVVYPSALTSAGTLGAGALLVGGLLLRMSRHR